MIKEKTYEKKASTKNGILRLVFVVLSLILGTFFFWGIFFTMLQNYISIITVANRLVAFGLVVAIYSQYRSPSIKMPWIMLMMAFPIVGVSLYLLIGLSGSTNRMRKRYETIDDIIFRYLPQNEEVMEKLRQKDPSCHGISSYILRESRYPIYSNTEVTYFDDAAKAVESQKRELALAKKFIFSQFIFFQHS